MVRVCVYTSDATSSPASPLRLAASIATAHLFNTMTAKPRAKPKKPRAKVVPKGVRFRARGPHKCIVVDGKSKQGLHNALDRVLGKCERTQQLPMPAPDLHMREAHTQCDVRKQGPPINAMKQGSRLDSQGSYRLKGDTQCMFIRHTTRS